MSIKRIFFIFIACLCLQFFPLRAKAGFFDPKLKWYTISTKHFNINFYNGEEEVAHRMAIIAERVYAIQSPKFKWQPWGRTELVLTDTTDVSNAFTTILPFNYILIFISAPPADSTLNYYDDWLEDLFTHEFTHTLYLDMYGGSTIPFRWVFGRLISPNGLTPGWVREGIAVQQESLRGKGRVNSSFSEMMLRTDILNDQFLAIDQMAGLQYEWPSFNASYIYGGKFWDYLAEKYGPEKIVEFSHRYSDSMWLFSLNNKARKTFQNKNFLKLKAEWKADLTTKYQKLKADLEAKGLTSLQDLRHVKGSLDNPTLSPDGKFLIYSQSDYSNKDEIRRINVDGTGDEMLTNERIGNQYSFSPDGKKIVYSSMGSYKYYYQYYDLYELDLQTKKSIQLTKGLRAFHPDYSPDGKKIVFVANQLDNTQMYFWDVEKKQATALTHEKEIVQFSNPRWSPDGKSIAVNVWKGGNRDIYLYNLAGEVSQQVTQDAAIDLNPTWSKDGQNLFFTSDRTGITNVYRYQVSSGMTEQISNILTGLFEPQYVNGKIIVKNYYGRGFDLKSFAYQIPEIKAAIGKAKGRNRKNTSRLSDKTGTQPILAEPSSTTKVEGDGNFSKSIATGTLLPLASPNPKTPESTVSEETLPDPSVLGDLKVKKYNPFKKLFIPRYILPGILFGDSLIITASTGVSDPIGRHIWAGGATYRTDANFLGGYFTYSYNRFRPSIFANFYDFVVNYGDIFLNNTNFFEQRLHASVGASIGTGQNNLAGYYFFEHRNAESAIPPGTVLPPTLGNFSGFGLQYTFTRVNDFPASISLEGGPRLMLNFEVTDQALGSSPNNEQVIFSGDLREYVALPLENHVLAFRLAGGINFGDKLLQGTFRLGSALGEGILNAPSPRLFTLRGLPEITFAGERGLLMSGEYRLPLVNPQRGLGTGPIQINKLYMAFFADYGSVFNGAIDFNNFLLGVGAELRGDFVIGYGLPITARLGYGIIVVGRQFIQGLTDPLTNTAVKNGVLILELGTSF